MWSGEGAFKGSSRSRCGRAGVGDLHVHWIVPEVMGLEARLEKALGVSEAVGIRLVPRQCLGVLGVA
jgi:hypothetical protein